MPLDQAGIEAERALAGGERLVEIAAGLQHHGEVVVRIGEVVPRGDRAAQQPERIVGAPEVEGRWPQPASPSAWSGWTSQNPAIERVSFGVATAPPIGVSEPQRFGRARSAAGAGPRRRPAASRALGLAPQTLLTAALCPVHGLPTMLLA